MKIKGIIAFLLVLLLQAIPLLAESCLNNNQHTILLASSPTLVPAQVAVRFAASSPPTLKGPICLFEWDFGDGETCKSMSATTFHTYADPGKYTVQLVARDGEGNCDFASLDISVSQAPSTLPSPGFTATATARRSPMAADFNAFVLSDSKGPFVPYAWRLLDEKEPARSSADYAQIRALTLEVASVDVEHGGDANTASQTTKAPATPASVPIPATSDSTSTEPKPAPFARNSDEVRSSDSGSFFLPFYLVMGINLFCALLNIFSLGRVLNRRQRLVALLVNLASIATASWSWVVGAVLLVLLLVAGLVASAKAFARFEKSIVNASIRFNDPTASKAEVMSYAKQVRASEKAAKVFGLQEIAHALEQAASLGITFGESKEVLPVSMLLATALSESHDLALQTLVLLARVFGTPFTRRQMTDYADKLVVAAQLGLPLERSKRELGAFRNTALMGHKRYSVDELLAAMTTLTRQGLDEVGAALGEIYNTIDARGKRYASLEEAVRDLAEPFLRNGRAVA